MNAYRYDRCGKYYDNKTGIQIRLYNSLIGRPDDVDLCYEYSKVIEEWLFTLNKLKGELI